jgi:Flp pilus assembly protein TadD
MLIAVLAVAVIALFAVTFEIFDTDFWQHLLVGRYIWETHSAPKLQLWTWPTYGAPDVNASWGFRALVWPFWSLGGVWGLFAWRWLTTLGALGTLWALGRRMGGRGFSSLLALLACAMVYRLRTQIRPETLVAVLIALELWILETRRQGGRDGAWWLVGIAWAWANAHISWYLGPVIAGLYLLDDLLRERGGDPTARGRVSRLAAALAASIAISFVNPWGWQALWQPFEYFLFWRHEAIFKTIIELRPVARHDLLDSPLGTVLVLWPALIAWRASRRRLDLVEGLLCAGSSMLMLLSRRFLGSYALIAIPFLMRAVGEWTAARAWPRWSIRPVFGAALVVAVCAWVAVGEARRVEPRPGVAIDYAQYPVRACDFIADHGIRGHGFNDFEYGGYQAWRFWPDRARLPFIDVHQAGTRLDRNLYVLAFGSPEGWRALDGRHHFDYCLITRETEAAGRLPDILDADSTWALVFLDDAATLYVRRDGPLAAVAARYAYHHLPGGTSRIAELGAATVADTLLRAAVAAELRRGIESSPWCSRALSLLANVALSEGRYDEARELLERGLRIAPLLPRVHERLGRILLEQGRPREALRELDRERASDPMVRDLALLRGRALRQLGDPGRAREWYQRELRRDPGNKEAADSLRALDRRGSS